MKENPYSSKESAHNSKKSTKNKQIYNENSASSNEEIMIANVENVQINKKPEKNKAQETEGPSFLFLCDKHSKPIKFSCQKHSEYFCFICKIDHMEYCTEILDYDKEKLEVDIEAVEQNLNNLKNTVLSHQRSLKKIIDGDFTKSEDISSIFTKIYGFLSTPIIKSSPESKEKQLNNKRIIEKKYKEAPIEEKLKKPNPPSNASKHRNINNSKESNKKKYEKEIIPRSNLIQDEEDQSFIKLMLENHLKKNERLNLIFQATKNGFKANDFHRICDGKSKTFIIAKSNYGNVYGGYASVPWQSVNKGEYIQDPHAFLYSLTYHTKHKQVKNNEFSIFVSKQYGPVFGIGFDLCIKDDCHKKGDNFCRLGNSFQGLSSDSVEDDYNYLGGNEYFAVEEYEVFQIEQI